MIGVLDAFNAEGYQNSSKLFTNFTLSVGSTFDIVNAWFIAPPSKASIYWMHFGADVPARTMANITLVGSPMNTLKTYSDLIQVDTIAREGVVSAQPYDLNYIASLYSTQRVYWSGFRLDNYFSPLVAFYVARTSPISTIGYLSYDRTLINEGNGWNSTTNRFVAPYSGVYFFSVSLGQLPKNRTILQIFKNGAAVVTIGTAMANLMGSGQDLVGRSHLMSLNVNDYVETYFSEGNPFSDSTNLQISFSGFFYNLTTGQQVSTFLF